MLTAEAKLVVTGIHTIAKISTPKGTHEFPSRLTHNELIYKISGHSTVTTGKLAMNEVPGIVRIMPADIDMGIYVSDLTDDSCEVVDIFFDTIFRSPFLLFI